MRARTKASTRVDTTPRGTSSSGKPPGGVIDLETYTRARAAYLATGNPSEVRKATGLGAGTVSRLIDVGEPRIGLPSLRDAARAVAAQVHAKASKVEKTTALAVADEQAKVLEERAKQARKAREHEALVLGDAARSRRDEVMLVRANRESVLVQAAVNADLLRVGANLARQLLDDEKSGSLKALGPAKKLDLIKAIAGVVQKTAQASSQAVQMERLLMGEPTAILGRADAGPASSMTADEAEQWFALAARAFERRARRNAPAIDVPAEPDSEEIDELTEDLAS